MPIPTHLITGFLGVGKTTAIRRLLAQRPENERWAILVNEFGQVGVDEELLAGQPVAIRQVPGGCLCCVASQAFTVGLNRLIREARPGRILIEPTGLGHPARIIDTLTGELYRDVLDLRAVITLMDARHLASARHREHPNWRDQIELADVLVANKADVYTEADRESFLDFARTMDPPKTRVAMVSGGAVDPDWLDLPRDSRRTALHPRAHDHAHEDDFHQHDSAPGDWLAVTQHGDGHHGASWLIAPHVRLGHDRILPLLLDPSLDRVKGILHTDKGWIRINRAGDEGQPAPSEPALFTRLEIIHHTGFDAKRLDESLRRSRLPD